MVTTTNFNIPNALTMLRIVATPIALGFYVNQQFGWCLAVVLVAALTDYFDGILARRLNQCTDFGALLDPVADKVFEMTFTLVLGYLGDLPWYYVMLLNVRNLAQLMSIPILMWWKKIVFKVAPTWPAKWGSALGMVVIIGVVLNQLFTWVLLGQVQAVLILISCGFELYMLVTYLPRFVQIYRGKHDTFI
ncbi:MAG: cardiolipin synthase [Porticoccus sp.]|jgi:cardiolipin synthase